MKVMLRLLEDSVSVVPAGSAPTTCKSLGGFRGLAGSAPSTIQPPPHAVPVQVVPLLLLQIFATPLRSSLIASLRAMLRPTTRLLVCVHCWSFCMNDLKAGTASPSRIESTTMVTRSSTSVKPPAGRQVSRGALSTWSVKVMAGSLRGDGSLRCELGPTRTRASRPSDERPRQRCRRPSVVPSTRHKSRKKSISYKEDSNLDRHAAQPSTGYGLALGPLQESPRLRDAHSSCAYVMRMPGAHTSCVPSSAPADRRVPEKRRPAEGGRGPQRPSGDRSVFSRDSVSVQPGNY